MNDNNEPARPMRDDAASARDGGRRGGHKHMGVATSDPDYLSSGRGTSLRPFRGGETHGGDAPRKGAHPNYGRLLESPSLGKPIFVAQRKRKARRGRRAIIGVACALVALVLIWYALNR